MTPAAHVSSRNSASGGKHRLPQRILKACLAAATSMVVFVLLAEGAARLAGWKPEPAGAALFRSLGTGQYYALAPGSISTMPGSKSEIRANNFGVRGRDVAAKQAGDKRIVVLGDSVAFGYELPEEVTFPTLLDRAYADAQPKADVVNGSIAAWSRAQERMFVERYGEQLKPDLILVTVVHNDLSELQVSEAELRVGVVVGNAFAWLGARSALVGELKRRMRGWVTDPSRLATVEARMQDPSSPRVLAALELEYRELDRIRELAAAQGARVGLVLMPYSFQLKKPGSEVLQQAHLDYARRNGLPVLDLLPVLRAGDDGTQLYMPGLGPYPDEVHFNADGHRRVADAIRTWIDENGLLTRP